MSRFLLQNSHYLFLSEMYKILIFFWLTNWHKSTPKADLFDKNWFQKWNNAEGLEVASEVEPFLSKSLLFWQLETMQTIVGALDECIVIEDSL